MANFRNIAVIRLSSFGDVVIALPAVEALRRTYPESRITWIVDDRNRGLLSAIEAIDDIIVFPRSAIRRKWKQPFGSIRVLKEVLAFRSLVRKRNFDLSIDFQSNLKSGLCTFLAGAQVRLGLGRAQCREPNYLFTNRRLETPDLPFHRIDRDLLLVGRVGVPFAFHQPQFRFTPEDEEAGRACIPEPHTGPAAVILNPATSAAMPNKRWPQESFARLGDRLVDEAGARILIAWGPGEEELANAVLNLMERPGTLVPETPSQSSLAALISRADLFVGADTGPVHLASALGVPSLNLVGPTDPRHYYPYGHPERVIHRRMPCSPCRNRTCSQRSCMEDLTVAEVADTALRVLSSESRA